jgi:hypothetical protein
MLPFKQAYGSIKRYKLFEVMNCYKVNKVSAIMEGEKAFVKVWNDLSNYFEVNKGLKRGDELIHLLFNMALEYAIRQIPVLIYVSGQIVGYVDYINIVGRPM